MAENAAKDLPTSNRLVNWRGSIRTHFCSLWSVCSGFYGMSVIIGIASNAYALVYQRLSVNRTCHFYKRDKRDKIPHTSYENPTERDVFVFGFFFVVTWTYSCFLFPFFYVVTWTHSDFWLILLLSSRGVLDILLFMGFSWEIIDFSIGVQTCPKSLIRFPLTSGNLHTLLSLRSRSCDT